MTLSEQLRTEETTLLSLRSQVEHLSNAFARLAELAVRRPWLSSVAATQVAWCAETIQQIDRTLAGVRSALTEVTP